MNIKRIISTVIVAAVLSQYAVFADTDMEEFEMENQQISDAGEQFLQEAFKEGVIDTTTSIPDYDKTGMTDREIILKNYWYFNLSQLGDKKTYLGTAHWALENENEDGSFPGLNYWDYEYAPAYTMGPNYRYLRCMYMAYITPDQELYQDKRLIDGIVKNLQFYHDTVTRKYKKGYSFAPWWNYTIGIPLGLYPLLLLAHEEIPYEITEMMCNDFLYAPHQMSAGFVTGQNAVWYAQQAIVRGALLDNEEEIEEGISIIRRECSTATMQNMDYGNGVLNYESTSAEGFQPDGSFHQHGPQFYLTYGNNTMKDFSEISMMLKGTKYEMKDLYPTFLNALYNGWIWTQRGKEVDISMFGRTIADKRTNCQSDLVLTLCKRFAYLVPEEKENLEKLSKYARSEDDPEREYFIGTKFFWRSDYLAHHRKNYSVYLHVNSERTTAMEHNNNQAEQATWVGFGNTYVTKDYGDTNTVSIPYWDWTQIPGVTSEAKVIDFDMSGFFMRQNEKFAGGISDGEYGAATMRQNKVFGTSANKSWFFFDDEFVMLGAGITSSGANEINTCIEQRFLTGDVQVDGETIEKGEKLYKNVRTVFHNNYGYVFDGTRDIGIRNKNTAGGYVDSLHGSGTDRNTYYADMFKLWVPHGLKPYDDSYEVIVIPETTAENLKVYSENVPIDVVANDTKQQGVYHNKLNMGYGVYYKNGTIKFNDNLSVTADSPCIIMLREIDGDLKVSISNPYNMQTDISLNVKWNDKNETLKFHMKKLDEGGYDYGGSSEEQIIKKSLS